MSISSIIEIKQCPFGGTRFDDLLSKFFCGENLIIQVAKALVNATKEETQLGDTTEEKLLQGSHTQAPPAYAIL